MKCEKAGCEREVVKPIGGWQSVHKELQVSGGETLWFCAECAEEILNES